ncbi:MAG TPA: alpha/beta hydrolase [Actinomycetota bacterium]|jgi:pimeloyl-ACP methyl ester carboxylesterase
MVTRVHEGSIEVNGLRFVFLEAGDGPLVLLLHGFPDNARTWEPQLEVIAGAGYRVVAPFLRGFAPTELPSEGYGIPAQGEDAIALIRALGDGPARVVGHDWGAGATFVAAHDAPELVERATVVAASHPATLLSTFERPSLIHHLFHVWFFQLQGFSPNALRADDYALVDYLWAHWSPGHDHSAHVARVKEESLSQPGAIELMAGYYQRLVNAPEQSPEFVARAFEPVDVPVQCIFGADDPALALTEGEESLFTAGYRRDVIEGAGHFVHRDRPDEFNSLLLEWLASERTPQPASAGRTT